MASGRTVCLYCGESVPSSTYQRHLTVYHKDSVRPLPLPSRVFKLLFYLASSVILFNLSLSGFNLYGLPQGPAEVMRLFFASLSGGLIVEFTISLKKFINKTGIVVTIEKKE